MHYYYVFESTRGYNTSVRLGKVYKFTSKETFTYILEVNPDIKCLNYYFHLFSLYVKKFLFLKNIKKYITLQNLLDRELGITTINQIISESCKKYNFSLSILHL